MGDVKGAARYETIMALIKLLDIQRNEITHLKGIAGKFLRAEYDAAGLTDCLDNDGKHYQSQFLADVIAEAEAALAHGGGE